MKREDFDKNYDSYKKYKECNDSIKNLKACIVDINSVSSFEISFKGSNDKVVTLVGLSGIISERSRKEFLEGFIPLLEKAIKELEEKQDRL